MGESGHMPARGRVVGFIAYAFLLALIQWRVISTGFTPNENAIWLYSGLASLLFGSRLLNPYFTPPADAGTNGFVALSALIAGSTSLAASPLDHWLLWIAVGFFASICIVAVVVLLVRAPVGIESRPGVRIADRVVRGLGSPVTTFTILILLCVWLFHRTRADEVYAILSVWGVIVVLRPIENALTLSSWIAEQRGTLQASRVIGPIAAYQSPGIVLVRQIGASEIPSGTPLVVADGHGPWMLGVALNYVGRDEGNLLRVLTTPLPERVKDRIKSLPGPLGAGVALALDASTEDFADDSAELSLATRISITSFSKSPRIGTLPKAA